MDVFHVFEIVQTLPNRTKRHIFRSNTISSVLDNAHIEIRKHNCDIHFWCQNKWESYDELNPLMPGGNKKVTHT